MKILCTLAPSRRLLSILTLSLSCALPQITSAAPLPQQVVYHWDAPGGPANVDTFATWINRPEMWGEGFLGQASWGDIQWPGWWTTAWGPWVNGKAGRKVLMGVPMLPSQVSGVTLAKGAAGEYNVYYRYLAQDLVAKNMADKVIVRLGWEMNGGWFKWRAAADPTSWMAYWRQIVDTMRAVPGASGLKFCFNPTLGWLQIRAETVYPGDAYVDHVAVDVYDESYDTTNGYPFPAGATAAQILQRRTWVWTNQLKGGDHGMDFWRNFASQHGKGFGIGEWGVNNKVDGGIQRGGLDNDYFIQQMYNYMTTYPMSFSCYFDVQAPDGHHQLSPSATEFPLASAKFKSLFSGSSAVDIIKDNTDSGVTFVGSWTAATTPTGFYGSNYVQDGNTDGKSVTWNVSIPTTGSYNVYARWVAQSTNNTWVPYTVTHAGGSATVNVNQTWGGGTWSLLGTWNFNAGATGKVVIGNAGGGTVVADAVRFTKQ